MNIKWTSYDEAEKIDCKELGGMGGQRISTNRRQYINNWYKPYDKYFRILSKEIMRCHYIFGGNAHQEHYSCCPVLFKKDKPVCKFLFSYRGWGDFMHSIIVNKKGEERGYMDFYMDICIPDCYNIKYPLRDEI